MDRTDEMIQQVHASAIRATDAPGTVTVFLNLTIMEANVLIDALDDVTGAHNGDVRHAIALRERVEDQVPRHWRE